MPPDTTAGGLTLAVLLTAGGAVVAAAMVAGIVQIFKTLLGDAWPGATASRVFSFVLSVIFVGWAYIGTHVPLTAESLFAGLLAWYGIARLAMAVYDDVAAKPGGLQDGQP